MKLILASNNAHKLEEFSKLVENMDIELVSQKDAGCDFEVDETGTTFEENAFLKAKAVTDATGCAAVADDSGLMVDALGGEPGIYSARYGLGHEAPDIARYSYLLGRLHNVEDRSAKFVSCICCTFPNGDVITAKGELHGSIALLPKGENGFGYDPVFVAEGSDRHNAELTTEEKNAISHRGKALREFAPKLEEYLRGHNN